MAIDLSRFKETFFQEAAEHLSEMEAGLLRLEVSAADPELLNSIFRSAHSIKGASGTFGFDDISKFTHELESLLDAMRAGRIAPSHELVNLLLHSVDVLGKLLEAARDPAGQQPAPPEMEGVLRELAAQRKGAPAMPTAATTPKSAAQAAPTGGRRVYEVVFEPAPNLFQLGLDPLLVLRDLSRMGELLEVHAELERIPALEDLQPGTCYLGWKLRLATGASASEVRDAFAFVEDLATVRVEERHEQAAAVPAAAGDKPSATAAQPRHQPSGTTIRVATEKVDKIIDLVGELVIAQSMATQIINGFTPARLQELQVAVSELERHTRELQDRVMRIRMLPIGSIFSRFPRLVRDTAEALGKEVKLQIAGEETELDKGVVERIADPLTHLIRNAVDHGIESCQERRAAGKPEQGVIRLTAAHQGGNVVVEVSDDGQGLDLARIRRKAVERGLAEANAELSEEQAYSLIFQPGFSTAEQVSDISGRGVGMDVVRKNVEALSGAVGISSQRGRGTSVRIKLPLTLAILDGLCLRVGDETYVLPLATIVESIQPRPDQVKTIAGRGEVVMVRGEPLTMLRLHGLFHVPNAETDPARALLVIVEHEGRRLALLVDELLGQQQVVIKSLETHYRKVEGITGATILGDGRAALILDVAGVAQLAKNSNSPCPGERREEIAAA